MRSLRSRYSRSLSAAFTISDMRRCAALDAPPSGWPSQPPDGLTLGRFGDRRASHDLARRRAVGLCGDRSRWQATAFGCVRSNHLSAQALPGTDGGAYPFWSPDSRSVGFFAQRKLKKVRCAEALRKRSATRSCRAVARGAETARLSFPPARAASSIACPQPVARPHRYPPMALNEERHWPYFLPDGRHFLYYGRPQKHGIYVAAIDSVRRDAPPQRLRWRRLLPPGYLLALLRSIPRCPGRHIDGLPFDPGSLKSLANRSPSRTRSGTNPASGKGFLGV